jgi:signal transduction histidine kinase
MIRPHGKELLLEEPLHVIYSYTHSSFLLLPETTPILTAMQRSLRRPPELLIEPIVVQIKTDDYRLLDIQELHTVSWQMRGIETQLRDERNQAKMIQNDKMASLGRLVDGVVHEILDPINFIWGNLTYVTTYTHDLLRLISAYEKQSPDESPEIADLKAEIEFDFLDKDLLRTLNSIRTGAERLKKLVISLQNFCHIDEIHPRSADIHACIDNIVLLINSRIKGEIEIIKNYGHLPPVYCFLGQLNQVFMNIFSHSVDGLLNNISFRFSSEPEKVIHKPKIEIYTEVVSLPAMNPNAPDSRWVAIRIADNGMGISPESQQEFIQSFSTQKNADKETSLAASYRIITARHGGKLNFRSELNIGSEFEILLPLV